MKNISLRTKILTGILTGGIYLSSVSTTFAITTNLIPASTNFTKNTLLTSECKQINIKIKQNLKTTIIDPIKEPTITNTITQDQANKIKSVINKSITTKGSNINYAKTISKQENKLYKSNNKLNYINPLTTLVDNGAITENQADEILMKQLYLYHDKMLKSAL